MFEDILMYLNPVQDELAEIAASHWGMQLQVHSSTGIPCDWDDFQIAFFSVEETRNSIHSSGFSSGPDNVRRAFYSLYPPGKNITILDLGHISQGASPKDTYVAMRKTMDCLLKKNKIVFILGAHKDLIYTQFTGYQEMEQTVNMVCLSHTMDISPGEEELRSDNYMGSIIMHQPNFLFNLSVYGYQEYYVSPAKLSLMEKLYFDFYRLGSFRDNPRHAEPVIRTGDIVTIDLGSLKHSDFPAQYEPLPNGFTSEEICLLARYAGMNDKLSSIGIYEYNALSDKKALGAGLISQILWYVTEGILNRKNDFPSRSSEDYLRFHVMLDEGKHEINFYKSRKSGRWWMEVPYPPQKGIKFERHTLVPCSEEDYKDALKNIIPDRWLLAYNKLF